MFGVQGHSIVLIVPLPRFMTPAQARAVLASLAMSWKAAAVMAEADADTEKLLAELRQAINS